MSKQDSALHERTVRSFAQVFSGYKDAYVQHTPPFTRGADGKLSAKSVGYAKNYGSFLPLEYAQYENHLKGTKGLAVSPLFPYQDPKTHEVVNDVCLYGIIDIDVYQTHFMPVIRALRRAGYDIVPFESKSGGLHIYFFFEDPEPATDVRKALKRVVETFGLDKRFSKAGVNKVEIFPDHDSRKAGVQDKCVFLPYFGQKMTRMLGPDGELLPIAAMLDSIPEHLTTLAKMNAVTDKLPFADAPFCVQSTLLNGDLGASSGRNEFLTTAAIYLQTKDGDGARSEDLHDMNSMLEQPLEDADVQQIFKSVMSHNYVLAGRCNKEPMCSICDKPRCKTRKYGVGKEKDNYVLNIEFGQIWKMNTAEPYYMWEAKIAGTDSAPVLLQLDSTADLMSQRAVQQASIKKLGQMMSTVNQKKWEDTLNKHLSTMKEKDVADYSDTTELSQLKDFFYKYLTHRKTKAVQPYMVLVQQVYYDGKNYYFQTDGLASYLRTQRFTVKMNLREHLMRYGCRDDGVLTYSTSGGEQRTINCWVMPENADLASMRHHYDDILDADVQTLQNNLLQKQGSDTKEVEDDARF